MEAVFGLDVTSHQVKTLIVLGLDVSHGFGHLTLPEFTHLDGGISVSQDGQFLDFLSKRNHTNMCKALTRKLQLEIRYC